MITDIQSVDVMQACAEKIARGCHGGEVIELVGDVGSGKTTFTKGIGRGLCVQGDIQSPSFTISRVYEARDKLQLTHYDFYRLDDAGVMAHDVAEVVADPRMVTVIEWADSIQAVLPENRLMIRFSSTGETTRQIEFKPTGERYTALVALC